MHPRPLSIAIERLIVAATGVKLTPDKVKAAVARLKTALEAIDPLTVGHPYELGHELSIADFYLIPVFTYLSQTPDYEATIAKTSSLRARWNEVSQLPSVKKVCA
jgi:glutathione S-transferase